MNFQQVEQGNGNLVQMFGTFTNIGGLEYSPQNKPKSICKVKDDTGVEHNVHIYQGKGQLPSPEQFSQRCQFNLSTFQGTYKNKPYTGYSGFWDSNAQTNQPQQPQRPRQSPSQSPQSTNSKAEVDWDAKELREKRGYAIRDAVLVQTTLATISNNIASYISKDLILDLAEEFVKYVYQGITKASGQQDEQPPEKRYQGGSPVPQAERDEIDNYMD